MPRYFFHIGDTDAGLDREGMELPDHNVARIEAVRVLGETLKDMAGQFWSSGTMKMIVTDEAGLVLFILDLSGTEAAAVSQRSNLRS